MASVIKSSDRIEVFTDPSARKLEDELPDHISADDYIYITNTPEEKKLVRKIDLRMLPILWVMYVLNYMDRTNIGNARVGGLGTDLSITSTQYAVIVCSFFGSYIVFEPPAAMLLTRMRPSWFLAGIMVLWGCVTLGFIGVQSYESIVALRVLVGAIEAGFYPGVTFLLSMWYTPSELAKRNAIFFSASILSSAFSGIFSGVIITGMDQVGGIRGWRWLFLLEGVTTVLVAVLAVFVLPDWPRTSTFLSIEERQLAHARVAAHSPRQAQAVGHLKALKLAVLDPKVWLLAIFYHFAVTVNSIAYFAPTLTKAMGYTGRDVQFMVAPIYVAACIISLIVAWSSDRSNDRALHMAAASIIAALGFMIPLITLNNGARYAALVIGVSGLVSVVPLWPAYLLSLIANDPFEKRAAAVAWVAGFGNIGGIIGSFLWDTKSAPRFQLGFGYCIACTASMAVLLLAFHVGYGRALLRRLEDDKETAKVELQVKRPVAVKLVA